MGCGPGVPLDQASDDAREWIGDTMAVVLPGVAYELETRELICADFPPPYGTMIQYRVSVDVPEATDHLALVETAASYWSDRFGVDVSVRPDLLGAFTERSQGGLWMSLVGIPQTDRASLVSTTPCYGGGTLLSAFRPVYVGIGVIVVLGWLLAWIVALRRMPRTRPDSTATPD